MNIMLTSNLADPLLRWQFISIAYAGNPPWQVPVKANNTVGASWISSLSNQIRAVHASRSTDYNPWEITTETGISTLVVKTR